MRNKKHTPQHLQANVFRHIVDTGEPGVLKYKVIKVIEEYTCRKTVNYDSPNDDFKTINIEETVIGYVEDMTQAISIRKSIEVEHMTSSDDAIVYCVIRKVEDGEIKNNG